MKEDSFEDYFYRCKTPGQNFKNRFIEVQSDGTETVQDFNI